MLDLEPIKARLAAATLGPWEADRDLEIFPLDDKGEFDIQGEVAAIVSTAADAALIAHAPADLAALVTEVERLRDKSYGVRLILAQALQEGAEPLPRRMLQEIIERAYGALKRASQ